MKVAKEVAGEVAREIALHNISGTVVLDYVALCAMLEGLRDDLLLRSALES